MNPDFEPPLIAHVIQRLAVGGLENGLVNLINHMPAERYRHAIICLADATDYGKRITAQNVSVFELGQSPGHDFKVHKRLFKLLRRLRPAIVHTRNLAAMEFQAVAALAGVPGRVHGEHGRDVYDLDGKNYKYNALRRAMRAIIHRYIAVSQDLAHWLRDEIRVAPNRVAQIYNGVDAERFHPRKGARMSLPFEGGASSDFLVVGTVGRLEPVKDQLNLVRAMIELWSREDSARQRARLMVVGDGSLREPAMDLLRGAGCERLAWFAGERDDVPELMRAMDLFVLPSLREGISNTILEAMATGLPVVATSVGGNPELIVENSTGSLVPEAEPGRLADAVASYFAEPQRGTIHGRNGRQRIEASFSMTAMVKGYLAVYDSLLRKNLGLVGAVRRSSATQAMPQ